MTKTDPRTSVIINTDGSCLGNPGPGGWAAVLRYDETEKELSGGFRLTTNNRMEVLAVIEALAALKTPCKVTLYSDSKYMSDAINKKWLKGWQKNGWKTASKQPVKNRDLWERLDGLLKIHDIDFRWVRGHAGNPDNERCDILAKAAASKRGLPDDPGYK